MITLLNKFDDGYIIQRKDVLDIISHYIDADGLSEYIKDVDFDNSDLSPASYNPITHKMRFNPEPILEYCDDKFFEISKGFDVDKKYFPYFVNFYYLYAIFHEIEHARQEKRYKTSEDKLYRYLYELCDYLHFHDNSLYKKNHSLFPMEIDAHNNGFLRSYQLLSYTKLPRRETRIMYLRYLYSLLYNYRKVNCFNVLTPIDKLSQAARQVDIKKIHELLHESRLPKIERFNLGVSVTPREYNSISSEKNKILTKEILRK